MAESVPEVMVRGPGNPDIVVVGGIHGDEPSGELAIRRVVDDLDLKRGVKFIIANPPALERGVRYVDVDMNRVFPGDSNSEDLERRLAAELCRETGDRITLALHSTQSQAEPFALVAAAQHRVLEVASRLPLRYVVDESRIGEGTYTRCSPVVSVESGCQNTNEAVDTAERMIRAFLQATGALPGEPRETKTEYYYIESEIEKMAGNEYTLYVDNFERVDEGDTYATSENGDLVADEPFYPVLMSPSGYTDILGFRAGLVAGKLDDAVEGYKELR